MSQPEAATHSTVLDVGAEQLGKTYARALLGAAAAAGTTESVLSQLAEICDSALGNNPQLMLAFESPRIDVADKHRIIDRLFGDADLTLVRFMKVMATRGRLGYLAAVRTAAEKLHDAAMNRAMAEVRTAVPLTDSLRQEIVSGLSSRFGGEVRLKEIVDPTLVGGMVIRVGDTVFDSSIASRLNKIGRAAAAGFARQMVHGAERFASTESS